MNEFERDSAARRTDGARNLREAKMDRRAMKRNNKDESRDLIRDNLRRVYDELVAEPVPSALLDLLKKLDDRENG